MQSVVVVFDAFPVQIDHEQVPLHIALPILRRSDVRVSVREDLDRLAMNLQILRVQNHFACGFLAKEADVDCAIIAERPVGIKRFVNVQERLDSDLVVVGHQIKWEPVVNHPVIDLWRAG